MVAGENAGVGLWNQSLGHRGPNGSGGGLQKPSFAATRSMEKAIADVGSIPIPGSITTVWFLSIFSLRANAAELGSPGGHI